MITAQQQQQLVLEQTRKQANLRLLQRTCNASITDIVQTATHVVLYEFVNQAWAKCPVEGSLFLTTCSSQQEGQPHELIILNRNSAENFQMKISWDLQMQDQDPYLIFKQPPPPPPPLLSSSSQQEAVTKIQGIWFHNTQDRLAVARIIESVLHALRNPVAVAAPPVAVPAPTAPPPATDAGYLMESSLFPSTAAAASAAAAAAAEGQATLDEREHLAALLSQTAVAVTSAAAASAPASAAVGGGKRPPAAASIPPTVGTASSRSSSAGSSAAGAGIALDKKSLQLALLSLIQDDRFLDLLHSQYLRVVHARSKKQQQQGSSSSAGNNQQQHDQHHHKDDL